MQTWLAETSSAAWTILTLMYNVTNDLVGQSVSAASPSLDENKWGGHRLVGQPHDADHILVPRQKN